MAGRRLRQARFALVGEPRAGTCPNGSSPLLRTPRTCAALAEPDPPPHRRRKGGNGWSRYLALSRPSIIGGGRAVKRLSLFATLIAAALVAAALSFGSSHREAPNTSQDPTADDTDVYAFSADAAPGQLTVVANWIPFEDPAGGPNFYNFDPKAHYYVNVD